MNSLDNIKLNLNILLCCDLPQKAEEALIEFEVTFISEEAFASNESPEDLSINFAIIDDVDNLEFLNDKYEFVQNHIRVISLNPVDNFNEFMSFNGRAVLHESWFNSKLGSILSHKILSESGSVHLNKNFSSLIGAVSTAKIGSHMKMGYYSDMLALDAFERNFNVVTMRGYLDHITYYFTYLKQSGISTFPLHLEYAVVDNLFFVQISASVRDFVGEYVNASVGQENPFDPYKHLIRSATFLTDFLDVTYVEQNEKLIFTGIWEELGSNTIKDRVQSFSFNNIFSAKQQDLVIEDKIKQLQSKASDEKIRIDKTLEKLEDKKLPGGPDEIEDKYDEIIEVDGHGELNVSDMLNHIIGMAQNDNPYVQLEAMTPDNLAVYLNGFQGDPELVSKISGTDFDDLLSQVQDFNLKKATNLNLDKVREEIKDDKEYKSFVRKALEENIKIASNGVISDEEVSEIVSATIDSTNQDESQLIRGNKEEKYQAQSILVSKLSEKMEVSKASVVGVDSLEKLWGREKNYVVKRSQETLAETEDGSLAVKSLGNEGLLQKIKQREDLIENMKGKMKTLMTQLKAAKESNDVHKEVSKVSEQAIADEENSMVQAPSSEKESNSNEEESSEKILGLVKEGQALTAAQSEELQKLLKRQVDLVKKVKKFQTEVKKKEIEARSASQVFNKKMSGMMKKIKAKDLSIDKAKSNLKTLSDRKDKQIETQTHRVKNLNSQMTKLRASNNDATIKKLEREKISATRQLEKFKKLSEEAMLRLRASEQGNRTGALETELKKQKRNLDILSTKVTKSEKDKLTAIQRFNEMKKFNIQLKSKFDQQAEFIKTSKGEITKVKDELKQSQEAVAASVVPIKEESRVEAKPMASTVDDGVEEHHMDVVELEHMLEQKDMKIKELEEKLEDSAESSIVTVEKEKTKIQTARAEITKVELKQMTTKLSRLEEERQKSIEDMRGAKKIVVDAKRDLKKKDMEIKAMDAKYKNLERQFNAFKQKMGGRKAS
jgi:hypothetical protein